MKKIILFLLCASICLSSVFTGAYAQNLTGVQSPEHELLLKPYTQMKYLKTTGVLEGISPDTSYETVLGSFKNPHLITVRDIDGNVAKSGNVGTGWTFTQNVSGECATALIYADTNGDSAIGTADVLAVQKYLAKSVDFCEVQLTAMNLNGDGKKDARDCLYLKKMLAGLEKMPKNSCYYYVSKSGNDANDGSENAPFLTIGKAASVLTAGETCVIGEGVYKETVTPKNSGEYGAPISFIAKQGEKVVISGTEKITSTWEHYKDGIYKTNTHMWRRTENQIFVNGEMAQIARYPNKNSDNFISVGTTLSADSASDHFVTDADLTQPDGFFNGARISTEGTSHYLHFTSTVTDYKKGTANFEKIDSGWDSPTTNSNYYFYDSLALLDAENEWYYDGNGTIYYKPKNNQNPNNLTFEYSVRPDAFDARDKSNIFIGGLEIFGASVKTNEGSEYLTLDSNKILYYYHTHVSRVYPWGANWYGVELWGENSVVSNCEIAYGAEGGVQVYADNCSVVNNYIHDINYINSNAAAIEPKYANYTLISHNTIDNIARSAIILSCKNMRVCYNKISNCAVNTHDVSGIGSYMFDAEGTVEVDHNIIYDCDDGHSFVAYYLDNGSMNYLVHHNVCYDVDLAMILNNPSYNNRIYNNTFLSTKTIQTGNMQNPWENNAFIGAVWDGDQFYNNIMPSLYYGTGAYMKNNLLSTNSSVKLNKDCTLQSGSIAIDKGIALPVGTDKFVGSAVDIGAYEYGETPWNAGQDLSLEFETEFSLSKANDNFTPVSGKTFIEMENFSGTDVVSDHGFENTTADWGGTGYKNITENVSTGNYAVEIESGWLEKTIDVTPGQMYYYSGDVKVGQFGMTTEFGVHFMDNNYNILNQSAFMITTTSYKTFETVFVVPAGTTKMRIFIANWESSKKVYCDNIKCKLAK